MINQRDKASFRDPAGYIYWQENEVYRVVMPEFADNYAKVRLSGKLTDWIDKKMLWPEQEVDLNTITLPHPIHALLHHPRLPFITYPYEWPFSLLKSAALLQLDLMLEAIDQNILLNDATAFNIQFNGIKPIFIDHLAFRPYEPGEFWQAHTQFFEQFVNPLLLQAYCGIPFQAWYRGNITGIPTAELARLLPWRRKLNWRIFCHIILQNYFDKPNKVSSARHAYSMPKTGLIHLWQQLRTWILDLQPGQTASHWQDYARTHSYQEEQFALKQQFIANFVAATQPKLLFDLGCNNGQLSQLALEHGAQRVIGFDNDHGALQQAYLLAEKHHLSFTPLYMNLTNPSPAQGWDHSERLALTQRNQPDAILALALIHHLAISQNIPLSKIVTWLVDLSPTGIIEFIPKTDPMIQTMLAHRPDIFVDYNLENFTTLLQEKAYIHARLSLSQNGRQLFHYQRLS